MLPFQVKVNLGVMAMKGYSTSPEGPGLEFHYQMQFNVISRTLVGEGVLSSEADVFYSSNQLVSLYWAMIFAKSKIFTFMQTTFEEYIYTSLLVYWFTNGPGVRGSISGKVIPKLKKWYLMPQHYKVHIKGKWTNPGKGVAPSPIPQCRSYSKGRLLVALGYSPPTV